MFPNSGDAPLGRFKAKMTRTARMGKVSSAPDNDEDDMVRPKLKPAPRRMKFLGSFKKGGHVHRTGLYLMHKGEHVRPAKNTMSRPR